MTVSLSPSDARYVYCVVPADDGTSFDTEGIGALPVHAVGVGCLSALVHACSPQPYAAKDATTVEVWVRSHHRVVEDAWRRWGAVVPFTFNTIVQAGPDGDAAQRLRTWLEARSDALTAALRRLRGMAEYGVQVFFDPAVADTWAADAAPAPPDGAQGAVPTPPGIAFLQRRLLERAVRRTIEARAAAAFQSCYERVRECADDVRVGKAGGASDRGPMLANLSCLVAHDRYPELAARLLEMGRSEGTVVRLVGPLPPYSFT